MSGSKVKNIKNVLYLLYPKKPGGAEISTMLLLKHLNKKRFNPTVLVPANSLMESELKNMGIRTIGFSLPKVKTFNPFKLIYCMFVLLNTCLIIRRIIAQNQIHFVHSVSNKRTAIYSIISARLARVPAVWTIRVLDLDWVVDQILLSLATKVIAISDKVKESFAQDGNINSKIVKITNAVDLEEYDLGLNSKSSLRQEWGFTESDFIVAIVSRIIPTKRQTLFIQAASLVLRAETAVKFVVVGDPKFEGDDSYFKVLINLTQELQIQDKIKFVGFERNIPNVMSNIDVLTLCCDNEPFGRVLIEAMAMKKPVVGPDSAGPREIISNGQDGYLVKPNDAESLADAILKLYRNKQARMKMGEYGRQKVEQKYSVKNHILQYEQVYKEVVGKCQ